MVGPWAFTQEQRGDWEMVTCYRLDTGDLVWSQRHETRYHSTIGGDGPRATPTVANGQIFTLGATGTVSCIELNGELVWRRDLVAEMDASLLEWGNSCSPLIYGDQVIVSVGGTGQALCALSIDDGSTSWCAGDDVASYCSPSLLELDGHEQIVILQASSVAGYDPIKGVQIWSSPWSNAQPNVAQPLKVSANQILVSSGYGVGSKLFSLKYGDPWQVTEEWRSPRMKAKFTNLVIVDSYVYGLDDGTLSCLSLADGSRVWRGQRYGHGQVLLVGRTLLVLAENGEVALVRASPDQFDELTRFTAIEGKTWNSPTLAGTKLLVRNGQAAACYELALQP